MSGDDPYASFLESYTAQQEPASAKTADADDVRPGEWRGVWTWIEVVDGEVLPGSLEILGRGREIAEELGTRNCAVAFGRASAAQAAALGEYGADRVYLFDTPSSRVFQFEPVQAALEHLVRDRRPEVFLFPATIQGRNLAAWLSAKLGTGIVPNCRALSLDPTQRVVIGQQTSFEEHLISDIACPTERPQILTVTPGSYRRPMRDPTRQAKVIEAEPPAGGPKPRVRIVSSEPDRPKDVRRYDAVVGAGLGVASKEAFDLSRALADEIGAYAGATRGAIACGWAEPDRLISDTRMRLRPRLYLAAGVVGEYDHLKAIEDAELVIALTHDPNLPMVENADLVGVGDPGDLLKRLVGHLRHAKKERVLLG